MYVLEINKDYRILHDTNKKQLADWIFLYRDEPERRFVFVTGYNAHKWVRDGGLHTTGLYLDGNFIRKAKGV